MKEMVKIVISDEDVKRYFQSELNLSYTPKPINLYISSGGGNVWNMLGLYDYIHHCSTPVHTIATGITASAACILLCSGKRRFAYPNSSMLIHSVSSLSCGKVEEMKENLRQVEYRNEKMNRLLAERTKISVQRLSEKDKLKEDWWITAEEALELGIIDEIIQ